MAQNSEGIDFRPDGTITLTIDGTVRTLRRPKLREYRHWADALRELAKEAQAEAVKLQELLAQMEAESSEEAIDAINLQMEEANQKRIEYSTPWIAGVVEQFTGKPLPEDVGEWPSWLPLDVSIPAKIINHWKKSPLAPGAAGTN